MSILKVEYAYIIGIIEFRMTPRLNMVIEDILYAVLISLPESFTGKVNEMFQYRKEKSQIAKLIHISRMAAKMFSLTKTLRKSSFSTCYPV